MLIVDRIFEGTVVIEDGESRLEVPKKSLSPDIREGDVVVLQNGIYLKDEKGTDERRKKIIEMQNNLWE